MTRRILSAGALLLVLAVLGLAAFAGWLLNTEAGLQFALARLETLSSVSITARGARGTIRGPLSFETLLIEHEAVRIEASEVELEPRLSNLLSRTLSIARLRVGAVTVTIRPREPQPPSEVHFMPAFLRLIVDAVELHEVGLVLADGQRYAAARLRGGVDIDRDNLRLLRLAVTDPAGEVTGDLRLRGGRPLGLNGAIAGHWRLPDQHDYRFALSASGDLENLATNLRLTSPARLSFHGSVIARDDTYRLVGTARAVDFDGYPWVESGRFPKLSGSVALDAGRDSIGVDATITSDVLHGEPLRLQGGGTWRDKVLRIESLHAWLPRSGASFTTAGTVDLRPADPVLTLAGEWAKLRWPMTEPPIIESALGAYRISGGLPYAFEARAETTGPDLPAAAWQASGLVDRDSLTLDSADAFALRGRLRATGRLAWTGEQSWQVSVNGRSLDLRELRADLPSRIDVAGTIEGRGFGATAPWTARIDSLRGTLVGRALSGRGQITHRNGEFELRGLRVANGESFARVDGRYGRTIDLSWAADLRSLSLIEPGLAGQLQASGRVQGPRERPWISGDAKLAGLKYGALAVATAEARVDLDLRDQRNSTVDVALHDVDTGVLRFDVVTVRADGRLSDHSLEIEVESPSDERIRLASLSGRVAAHGALAADWRGWTGELTETKFAYPDGAATLLQPAAIEISAAAARAAPICLEDGESRLCAEGEWQASPERWRLIYSAQDWPLRRVLTSLFGWHEFDGMLQAGGWIGKEPGQAWLGASTVLLDDTTLDIPRNRFRSERVRLGGGRLDLFADRDRIRSNFLLAIGEKTQIEGEAHAERLPGGPMSDYPVTGQIHGGADSLTALPLLVPEVDRSGGRFDIDIKIDGTLGQPTFNGEFSVRDGQFAMYRTNLVLSNTQLEGRFAGDEVIFEGRGATSGGSMTLDGRFRWPEGVMNGVMHLRGDQLLVADTPEFRIVASPDLTFTAGGDGILVTGRVDIPSALIAPRDLTTTVRTSPDERIVGMDFEDTGPSTLGRVRSRIDVVLGDDVRVNSYGLRARLGGAVTISSVPQDEPRGRGAIHVIDGQYRAFGQDVRITRGRLSFEDSPLSQPILDIVAERRIEAEDVTVAVNVRGSLDSPFITLSSTPSMSQNEALSYLLTGRSINNLQTGDQRTVDAAAEGLALGGGGLLLGPIGQRLGLDEVTVERTSNDDTAVVLGKHLSARLFVSYGISISEAINTIKLRYTLNERWALKAEAGQDQSGDVEFRIERP